jgi:hypothetical protein
MDGKLVIGVDGGVIHRLTPQRVLRVHSCSYVFPAEIRVISVSWRFKRDKFGGKGDKFGGKGDKFGGKGTNSANSSRQKGDKKKLAYVSFLL